MMGKSGTKLERRSADVVPGTALRPLRDHIIVRPLEWRPSSIITIAGSQRKTLRGTVLAVGPGCFQRKYNAPKGPSRTKTWDSQKFTPTEVRVGDTVELGGLEIDGYSFPEVMLNNETVVVCREADIVGIHI